MIGKRKHTKLNKNYGFSMVELIVVIVIVMIMAGAMAFGVAKWVNFSHFSKQNEYAATLFLAAQNQLSEYDANGRLAELEEALMREGGDYKPYLLVPKTIVDNREALDLIPAYATSDSARYFLDELWPQSADKDNPNQYRSDVCFLSGTEKTYLAYQKYRTGQTLTSEENGILTDDVKLLYEILLPYVYDQSILQAAVCLEFSPSDGQVFALLYSNDGVNKEFTYTMDDQYSMPGATNYAGLTSIKDRRVDFRKKRSVGYYGVDTLTKVIKASAAKPAITNVNLHNEDTLNLSFRLSKYKEAIKALTYNIDVFDKNTAKKRLSIVMRLPGRIDMDRESMESEEPVLCDVTRYAEDGTTLDTRQYPFLVWLEDNYTVRLVLDAADESADSYAYDLTKDLLSSDDFENESNNDIKIGYAEPFMQTFSFHRFGIDSEEIYCGVRAGGDIFAASALKKSNESHVYFAKAKNSDQEVSYELKNGRHLYNIRYVEDTNEASDVSSAYYYRMANDINWSEFAKNAMYCTKAQREGISTSVRIALEEGETLYPFISIRKLRQGNTFDSESGLLSSKQYTISELTIDNEKNKNANIYSSVAQDGTLQTDEYEYTGLFVQNYGSISKIGLDSIRVTGNIGVGAFCGANCGQLSDLSVKNTENKVTGKDSVIQGTYAVGGVFGVELMDSAESTYNNLINYAKVDGTQCVGGITGKLQANDEHHVLVENCKNYGVVEGIPFDDNKAGSEGGTPSMDIRYLGGIAGLCLNQSQEKDTSLILSKCIGSPQDSKMSELETLLNSEEGVADEVWDAALAGKLQGTFVGGIVGYNSGATLVACNTKSEKEKQGYVIGYRYVGGIVGYNAGMAGNDLDLDGGENINEANVIGDSYVGGIVGCNATLDTEIIFNADGSDNITEQTSFPEALNEKNLTRKISNWKNKGIVCAKSNYAGGIVGYNAGAIENCYNEVKADIVSQNLSKAGSLKGDDIGGIAGYNNGNILAGKISQTEDRVISTVSYVYGRNNVGGIVGYNDADATIEGYQLSGGYINGCGDFVGGYVGLNLSKDMIHGKALYANPNRVTGRYFVGGSIGGNILEMDETQGNLTVELNTDNFLGYVQADAFVGGFIGYNHLVAKNSDVKAIVTQVGELVGISYEELPAEYQLEEYSEAEAEKKVLLYIVNVLEDTEWKNCNTTDLRLVIQALNDGENQQNKFGGITAKIYVGGVVGYNNTDTALTLRNVENKTRVNATKAIANVQEAPSAEQKYQTFKYSYAGGVIGKVGKKVVVDYCNNADAGDVVSVGTYLGGVCEVNEGVVLNCQASNIGTSDKSYVGGVVGLNKKDGIIEKVEIINNTITGDNYVGGIVAENYGEVKNVSVKNGIINGGGNYIGGVAAVNYGDIIMTEYGDEHQAIDEKLLTAKVTIQGSGTYVGGLVGYNRQKLIGVFKNHEVDTEHLYVLQDGNVHGAECVGGVVGMNIKEISGFKNASAVNAMNGEVGGIAGKSASNISYCENDGTIVAMKEGNAGGIVSHNNAKLEHCKNTGSVTASNGNCGGITGENAKSGYIYDCEVSGTATKQLLFEGLSNVGGVCAENYGEIVDTSLTYVTASNTSKSKNSNIGVVAGVNCGKIKAKADEGSKVEHCIVQTYKNACNVGGIVGINSTYLETTEGGEIKTGGEIDGLNIVDEKVIFAGFDENASGVDQFLQCSANYGNLGGVAGKNLDGAKITNCDVRSNVYGDMGKPGFAYGGIAAINEGEICDVELNANVYGNGSASTAVVLGGIVGINKESGVINRCYIGTVEKGENGYRIMSGYVVSITYPETQWDQKMGDVSGVVGGFAGENYGKILNCDNAKESVAKVTVQNGAGHLGGIVGYLYPGAVVSGTAPKSTTESPKWLSTGKNWKVVSWAYNNDSGTGGIIGYTKSGENIVYVKNYANVTSAKNKSNTATGGLIGRSENQTKQDMLVEYFENYGYIKGGLAGGAVGRFKFKTATVRNCSNYGKCESDGTVVAGIVASTHQSDIPAVIQNCVNYGEISGIGMGAGIVARTENAETVIENCINFGSVNTTESASGIISFYGSKASVYNCRNYANSTQPFFAGIGGLLDAVKANNCFSIGQSGLEENSEKRSVQKNIKNAAVRNVYTLCDKTQKEDNYIFLNQANASKVATGASVPGAQAIEQLNVDAKAKTSGLRYTVDFTKTTVEKTIQLNLEREANISELAIKFANDNDANKMKNSRTYKFKLSVLDQLGQEYWLSEKAGSNTFVSDVTEATVYTQTADMYAEDSNFFRPAMDGEIYAVQSIIIHVVSITENVNGGEERKVMSIDYITLTENNVEKRVLFPGFGVDLVVVPDDNQADYKIVRESEYFKNQFVPEGEKSYSAYIPELKNNPEIVWKDFQDFSQETDRYRVFEELDKKVVQFMKENETECATPNSISYNYDDGILRIKWGHAAGGYYQDILVYRTEDNLTWSEPIYIPMGVCMYRIPIQPEWYGRKFEVAICSMNGRFEPVTQVSESKLGKAPTRLDANNTSTWAFKSEALKEQLPIPKVHLELGIPDINGVSDPTKYVAVLENPQDYEGDKATQIEFKYNNDNKWLIDTSVGYKSAGRTVNSYADQKMTAQALKNDKYAPSILFSREFSCIGTVGTNSFITKDQVLTTFQSFYGDRSSGLYYQLKTKKNTDRAEYYINIDLVAKEYPIGEDSEGNRIYADLTVAQGSSHVSHNGDELVSALTDLPVDLFDQKEITVRTYPWKSQADVMFYGHYVKKDISPDEISIALLDLMDEQRSDSKNPEGIKVYSWDEENKKGKLTDGYVLFLNKEGKYEVFYSVILDINNKTERLYKNQIDEVTYTVDRSTHPGKVTAVINKQNYDVPIREIPVIKDSCPLAEENDVDYTFTWDEGVTDLSAEYDLKLYGYAKDGTEILLEQVTVGAEDCFVDTNGGFWQIVFKNKASVWDYPKYRLLVERVGAVSDTVNISGQTTCFPAYAEQIYFIKERLSQIARPTVELLQNSGVVEKNSLIYNVTWKSSPSGQREYVAEYEILVQPKNGANQTTTFTSNEEYSAALDELIAYYNAKENVTVTQLADENATLFVWEETGTLKGFDFRVNKEVKIAHDDENLFIEKTLTEKWYYDAVELINANSVVRPIDLNEYDRGLQLQISVRSKAFTNDDCPYRDGPTGVERDVTLPDRLMVPDLQLLDISVAYDADGYIEKNAFTNDGITLTYEDNTPNAYQGKYQIAIAVDNKLEASSVAKVKKVGDAQDGDGSTGYWNSGVEKTVYEKGSEKEMTGDFYISDIEVKHLDAKYAGLWLKACMRAVSDSNISSWWSDEDESLDKTLNYRYFRLPRVRLDIPNITTDPVTQVFYDQWGNYSFEQLSEGSEVRRSDQTTISFEVDELADVYHLERIRKEANNGYGNVADADWISLKRNENGEYLVYVKTTEKRLENQTQDENASWDNDMICVGTLPMNGEAMALPFEEQVVIDAQKTRERATMFMQYNALTKEVKVILPDAENMSTGYTDDSKENLLTSQISVWAEALEDNKERFEDSAIACWYRDETGAALLGSFEEKNQTQSLAFTVKASKLSDVAYEVTTSSDKNVICLVELLNNDKSVVYDRRYLGACKVNGTDSDRSLYLTDEIYARFNPQDVNQFNYLRVVAYTVDDAGAGIALPTEEIILELPILQLDSVLCDVSDTDIFATYEENGENKELHIGAKSVRFAVQEDAKMKGFRIFAKEAEEYKFDVSVSKKEDGWYVGENKLEEGVTVEIASLLGKRVLKKNAEFETVSSNDFPVGTFLASGDINNVTAKVYLTMEKDADDNLTICVVMPGAVASVVDAEEGQEESYDFYDTYSVTQIPVNEYYHAG